MKHSGTLILLLLAACATDATVRPLPKLSTFPLNPLTDCSSVDLSTIGLADIVIAFDRSASTHDPTGFDIDRDGETGVPIIVKRSIFDAGSTDPGDSYLAAQVVAAHSLVDGIAGGDARIAIVAFSGSVDATPSEIIRLSQQGEALPRKGDVISSNLTNEAESLTPTLADILADRRQSFLPVDDDYFCRCSGFPILGFRG